MSQEPERSSLFFSTHEAVSIDVNSGADIRPGEMSNYFSGSVRYQALVDNRQSDGFHLATTTFAPDFYVPRHEHDVDYIEFVLDGEVHYGNRVVRAGEGVFRKAGTRYSFRAGPNGARLLDFRAQSLWWTVYHEDFEEVSRKEALRIRSSE